MMALKMLYRGPSSRLENLIEKIQATKEISNNDMYSTHTSSSYSPSISDGTLTPNSHLPLVSSEDPPQPPSSTAGEDATTTTTTTTINGNNGELEKMVVGRPKRPIQLHHQHHYHHHHHQQQHQQHQAMKIANKLRKINKEAKLQAALQAAAAAAAASGTGGGGGGGRAGAEGASGVGGTAKFDKLTGDGIKSRSDGSYQCQFCDKSFPRLGYLKHHVQSHAEHLPFKCEYCAKLFKHKRSRDRHKKLHTNERNYKCPHCEAAFSRSDHLKIHMKTHDMQKPFQCSMCNRGYNTAAALTSHMQKHKKNAALLAAGANPNALNYSPRSTGSASSGGSLHKRRYALALASDSSPSRLEFPKRARGHATPTPLSLPLTLPMPLPLLRCTQCPKAEFNSLEQLNGHLRSVHEPTANQSQQPQQQPPLEEDEDEDRERSSFQLNCEYCTMKFGNIAALFQHMRTTHLDRLGSPNASRYAPPSKQSCSPKREPMICTAADQDLPPEREEDEPTDLSSNKRRESATTPPHASPKVSHQPPQPPARVGSANQAPGIFLCNQCNAGLPDFESFRNHLKSHIAEGLHLVCPHCGLTLPEPGELERHVIAHFLITNSEFNCAGSCSKSYAKAEELQRHLLADHVVTMLKCALCAELCDSQMAMQLHFACAHTQETKLLRCSACMELFRTDADFHVHVKTRHQAPPPPPPPPPLPPAPAPPTSNLTNGVSTSANSLQCVFCRAICSSELEMHFHLAAHARQFRCPSCPETFHVEFLLDRHMQSQHGGGNGGGGSCDDQPGQRPSSDEEALSPMNSFYVSALFGGKSPLALAAASANNNNSILDYNVAFAAAAQLQHKGLFAPPPSKFYSPLQVDTGGLKAHPPPPPALMYGLGQRYFMEMYAAQQAKPSQVAAAAAAAANSQLPPAPASSYFAGSPKASPVASGGGNSGTTPSTTSYSCGMCERQDLRSEAELHAHRKIAHNMKTGVSLRCAYCAGNFKSRSELEQHMKSCHNSSGKHKCLICDEVFPSPAILAEHKLQHSKVGQSGKCFHCGLPLPDVAAFRAHLQDHQPNNNNHLNSNNNNNSQSVSTTTVQCICCRQTLNSEFEIGLHAKFHTKSGNGIGGNGGVQDPVCALCLQPLPMPPSGPTTETPAAKLCDKCCRKHSLSGGKQRQSEAAPQPPSSSSLAITEHRCNLCKLVLPHAAKLQEHLVEHTFAGTEQRGYNCYICSAVFTVPGGLLAHMVEHGAQARPYDCSRCPEKFHFRAELEHHQRAHDQQQQQQQQQPHQRRNVTQPKQEPHPLSVTPPQPAISPAATPTTTVKVEQELEVEEMPTPEEIEPTPPTDDDEYIEVEQMPYESGRPEESHSV